jgi:hypothetical protein
MDGQIPLDRGAPGALPIRRDARAGAKREPASGQVSREGSAAAISGSLSSVQEACIRATPLAHRRREASAACRLNPLFTVKDEFRDCAPDGSPESPQPEQKIMKTHQVPASSSLPADAQTDDTIIASKLLRRSNPVRGAETSGVPSKGPHHPVQAGATVPAITMDETAWHRAFKAA